MVAVVQSYEVLHYRVGLKLTVVSSIQLFFSSILIKADNYEQLLLRNMNGILHYFTTIIIINYERWFVLITNIWNNIVYIIL